MSDHYLVYCIRELDGSLKRDHKIITARVMKRSSEKYFLDDVAKAPWEQVVQSSNEINELVIKWTSLLSSLIDKHAQKLEFPRSFALGSQLILTILSEKETI